MLQHVPVFPLSVMPFPGCRMPLRIFEPRYVDMIGEVMREQSGFVITLQADPNDVDEPYMQLDTGMLTKAVWVEIEDFSQGDEGLLHIEVASRKWVEITELEQDDNDLWRASAADFQALINGDQSDEQLDMLYRVVQDAAHSSEVHVPDVSIATNEQKVGYLALLLPIGVAQRVMLACAEDNAARVSMLHQWVSISES